MARVMKRLFVVVFMALLAISAFQIITARFQAIPNTAGGRLQQPLNQDTQFSNSAEPGAVQGEIIMSMPVQPAIWFGLAASLIGAMVFWGSVVWMAKRRGY